MEELEGDIFRQVERTYPGIFYFIFPSTEGTMCFMIRNLELIKQ